ncbi:ADP-ribosyl cyclase/cyclic ADP-ribose hydrolase [Aphelenchoides besseyi]|nr:ADP-ribosyl cyclase/cyclic ADP-ribose hydrolase [Aphelenchoides besseyi]
MAGKAGGDDKEKPAPPTDSIATTNAIENERFQLSRQDASVNSRKSPLGRTDELLLELDDDELDSAFSSNFTALPSLVSQQSAGSVASSPKSVDDVTLEENEPVAPLKRRPIVGLYSLKSPTMYSANKSFENGILRGSNGTLNGSLSLNGELQQNDCTENHKLTVYANENHAPISPSVSAPLTPNRNHLPVSPSTSVIVLPSNHNHNWKTSSLRSTTSVVPNRVASPNGSLTPTATPAIRQQTTVDETHLSTTRSFSLKLEVPSADASGSWSCTNSPQPSNAGSTAFLYSATGSVESNTIHGGDMRLQQSLSTPCPGQDNHVEMTIVPKKESEYRRFKSEGSTAGSSAMPNAAEIDVAIDDLSPIGDHRSSPPHRLNIFQIQDSVNGPLAKHSQTEQVMMMHTLKTKLQKYQGFIDKAFQLIQQGGDEQIFEGCTIVTKVMTKAWMFPKISHDLAYALCDYLRDQNYFDILINLFIKPNTCESVRSSCGGVLEECMSLNNRDYIVTKGYLRKLVTTAEKLNKNKEQQRMSLSIMESLFKHSTSTTSKLIEYNVLDHILLTCKRATDAPITLRHAALALANLSLYSSAEAKKKIIQKKLPDWLFLLASQPDDITRYYACLAICMLGSSKEMEAAVIKSGTLSLVEPFLLAHQPVAFAGHDYKHSQGRPKEWLKLLLPMLSSKCREAKSMAAFHFTMEAAIKKDQQKLEILQEIEAIDALKEVASSPDEVAAKFASEALTIIGEEVPYKLSQQVPLWTISDVQYWVEKIGFGVFSEKFASQMVDGDLLLRLTEKELEEDLSIKSGLLRKRFMRELESLKIAADYSSVDETQLDQFLMSLGPELSVYTYQMLGLGLRRPFLPQLTNEVMKTHCGIENPIHRLKLRQALQDSKHIDDIEVAILSKQIDVFISYRRSTGNQLASLIKVFIDVDKLYAGKFDSHLLKNIQAAKHFILVLTPHSLDRLLNDNNREDWIHKELHCAFEHHKNVIPIFDQHFEFPAVESELPDDIRQITKFNGVRWVHDYQEACIDKVERFIKGELNRSMSLGPPNPVRFISETKNYCIGAIHDSAWFQANVRPSSAAGTSRKPAYKLGSSSAVRSTVSSVNRNKTPTAAVAETGSTAGSSYKLAPTSSRLPNQLAIRSSSMEKQRRKLFSSSVSTVYSEK